MADQSVPPTPPTVPPAPPEPAPVTPPVSLKDRVLNAIKDLWAKYNILFIIVGVALLVAKFGNLLIDLLTWFSKKEVDGAKQKDAELKAKEDAANQQANAFVQDAKTLPSKETPVDENWNKKK